MIRLLPGDQLWDRYRVAAVGPEALDGAWLSSLRNTESAADGGEAEALTRFLLLPLERPVRHPLPQFLHAAAQAGLLSPRRTATLRPLSRRRRKSLLASETPLEAQAIPFLYRATLIGQASDGGLALLPIPRNCVLSSVSARCGTLNFAQSLRILLALVDELKRLQELLPSSAPSSVAVWRALTSLLQPNLLALRGSDAHIFARTGLLHTLPPGMPAPAGEAGPARALEAAAAAAVLLTIPAGRGMEPGAVAARSREFPEGFRALLERCLTGGARRNAALAKIGAELAALQGEAWAASGKPCISCGFWLAADAAEEESSENGENKRVQASAAICPCCGQEQFAGAQDASAASSGERRASASGRMRRGGTALLPRETPLGKQEGMPSPAAIDSAPDGMVVVPGGPFLSGERKVPRTLRMFAIDTLPVTEGEYKSFLAAVRKAPRADGPGTRGPQFDRHPVTRITWHEANEFAEFHGKRLPTIYEWEKAARGPDGRKYPFGNTYRAECGRVRMSQDQPRPEGPAPVGSYLRGASPCGALDMAGNVLEWTCSARRAGERFFRALKGACYKDGTPELARCTSLQYLKPETAEPFIGFRCVKDID